MGKSAPSEFSKWMRNNLLASWKGLITQDIDVVIFDDSLSSFILIEEKNSSKATVRVAQAICFKMLDEFLNLQNKCKYCGSYLIYYLSDNEIYINPKLKQKERKWSYTLDLDGNNLQIDKNALINLICSNFTGLCKIHKKDWFSFIISNHIEGLYDCKSSRKSGTHEERSQWRGSKILNLCNHNRMKNINWIFINYCTGYFILIEERCESNGDYKPNPAESKLIDKINDIFYTANNINQSLPDDKKVKNPKSEVPYEYLGYFLLEFDGEGPESSNNIYLNHKPISKDKLKEFLNLNSINAKTIGINYRCKWW
ncbi:hypothetical protein ACO3UB_02760 [Methanocaldococcus sp. 16A]